MARQRRLFAVTLYVEVNNAAELVRAARQRARQEPGWGPPGIKNTRDALACFLDPGSGPPGCEIDQHEVRACD